MDSTGQTLEIFYLFRTGSGDVADMAMMPAPQELKSEVDNGFAFDTLAGIQQHVLSLGSAAYVVCQSTLTIHNGECVDEQRKVLQAIRVENGRGTILPLDGE